MNAIAWDELGPIAIAKLTAERDAARNSVKEMLQEAKKQEERIVHLEYQLRQATEARKVPAVEFTI